MPTTAPTEGPEDSAPTEAPVSEVLVVVDLSLNDTIMIDGLRDGRSFADLLADIEVGVLDALDESVDGEIEAVARLELVETATIHMNVSSLLPEQQESLFSALMSVRCGDLSADKCVVEQVTEIRTRRALQLAAVEFRSKLSVSAADIDMQGTSPADETRFLSELNDLLTGFEGVLLDSLSVDASTHVDIFEAQGTVLAADDIAALQSAAADTSAIASAVDSATGDPGLVMSSGSPTAAPTSTSEAPTEAPAADEFTSQEETSGAVIGVAVGTIFGVGIATGSISLWTKRRSRSSSGNNEDDSMRSDFGPSRPVGDSRV